MRLYLQKDGVNRVTGSDVRNGSICQTLRAIARARPKGERDINGRIGDFFSDVDFLVCPTAQVPPFPLSQEWVKSINGVELSTYIDWMGVCYAITVTGLPALSLPVGFTDSGLPIGLQIIGRRHQDFAVLQLGYALEQALGIGARRPALISGH